MRPSVQVVTFQRVAWVLSRGRRSSHPALPDGASDSGVWSDCFLRVHCEIRLVVFAVVVPIDAAQATPCGVEAFESTLAQKSACVTHRVDIRVGILEHRFVRVGLPNEYEHRGLSRLARCLVSLNPAAVRNAGFLSQWSHCIEYADIEFVVGATLFFSREPAAVGCFIEGDRLHTVARLVCVFQKAAGLCGPALPGGFTNGVRTAGDFSNPDEPGRNIRGVADAQTATAVRACSQPTGSRDGR